MAPPAGPIPPPLPPSVEESYRRKCIQLKQRMNEVEEANDASRIRLNRMKRGIEKLRLERAFLLEQLAKRTSTNVEDSEGSPSPPPTPKEKPLRTKRGHRKPSFLANIESGRHNSTTFVQGQNSQGQAVTLSPSNSDALSHTQTSAPRPLAAATTNGTKPTSASTAELPGKRPRNPFELFAAENRAVFKGLHLDVDKELATKWKEMSLEAQNPYCLRFEAGDYTTEEPPHRTGAGAKKAVDEDVEMGEEGDDDES